MAPLDRKQQLFSWLSEVLNASPLEVVPLKGDASARQYFRVLVGECQYIAMDHPNDEASTRSFLAIAEHFNQHQILSPLIYAHDLARGFLLLSDLGDLTYLKILNDENADLLYRDAIHTLLKIQTCPPMGKLPSFNATVILEELARFDDWFIQKFLHLKLTPASQKLLKCTYTRLVHNATSQPQVFTHRDYHADNLMWIKGGSPGVLDFQDAMLGPVTYDLVALLKDSRIAWPPKCVELWVDHYYTQARTRGVVQPDCTHTQFRHWFDWMGVQLHLKIMGIFARLHLRDDKSQYLCHIPRIFNYITHVASLYKDLIELGHLFEDIIMPRFEAVIKQSECL